MYGFFWWDSIKKELDKGYLILLMGFTEKEYEKTIRLDLSYRKMNKLIGNSIVVNVLQAIFEVLFKNKYGKKDWYA